MKRILQAMDGVATKPVVGADSMAKFLSIVDNNASVAVLSEGANPHKVALPIQMAMQHYQQKETAPVKKSLSISKYLHKVEEELAEEQAHKRQLINQYASTIAERVLMKEAANPAQQAAIAIAKKKKKAKLDEKSVSKAQFRTMAAVANNPEFAKKVGIKPSVGKEFHKADKKQNYKNLPDKTNESP